MQLVQSGDKHSNILVQFFAELLIAGILAFMGVENSCLGSRDT